MSFFPDIFLQPEDVGYGQGGFGEGGYGGGSTANAFIAYYQSLFTSQYQNSTNLLAWFHALAQPYADLGLLFAQWFTYFDIDQAIGSQLDTLGQIIGVGRTVNFAPTGGGSPVLSDTVYRVLLKARIALNQWDGKIGSMYAIWQQLFPGGQIVIVDNQNMTATITLTGAFSQIVQDLINHDLIVPRPEGVAYTFVYPALPMFGYDAVSSFITGYDKGRWV